MSDDPTVEDVERELRLARARELADRKAEEAAMRANLPVRVDTPASPIPYLGATGVSLAAMAGGILALGLPALTVATWGLTFLGVAMVLKRMDDVPPDHPNGLVRWLSDRVERMRDSYGVELYGVISLTTFIQYEIASLSTASVPLQRILSDVPGGLIEYLVTEMIESIMNAVWAALWWMPLFGGGWQLALAVIAAAWAVLWVLDMPDPPPEDYGGREIAELGKELEGLAE